MNTQIHFHWMIEELAVSATPFIEMLCYHLEEQAVSIASDDTMTLTYNFIENTTNGTKDHHDNYHNVSHDAILRDISVQQKSNELQHHHFVLVLPEIQMDYGDTESDSSEEFTFLERAFSILLLDVQSINFEVTTTSVPVVSDTQSQYPKKWKKQLQQQRRESI